MPLSRCGCQPERVSSCCRKSACSGDKRITEEMTSPFDRFPSSAHLPTVPLELHFFAIAQSLLEESKEFLVDAACLKHL